MVRGAAARGDSGLRSTRARLVSTARSTGWRMVGLLQLLGGAEAAPAAADLVLRMTDILGVSGAGPGAAR